MKLNTKMKGQHELIIAAAIAIIAVTAIIISSTDLLTPTGKAPPCEGTAPTCGESCTATVPGISAAFNSTTGKIEVTISGQAGNLKRRETGTTTWINLNNSGTFYEDSNIVPGKSYDYLTSNSGIEGYASCDYPEWTCSSRSCTQNSVIATAAVPLIPGIPQNATAVSGPGVGQITINWNTVTGATYYEVFWARFSPYTKGTLTASTNTIIHSVSDGAEHYYGIKACNASGCSEFSSGISGSPKPGVEITAPSSAPKNQVIQLTSTPLYAAEPITFSWTIPVNPANCTFTASSTAQNTSITCTGTGTINVLLTMNSYNGTATDSASISIVDTVPIPGIPSSIWAILPAGYTTVKSNWNSVTGADYYKLRWKTDSTAYTIIPTNITSTSYNHTGLLSNTTYTYSVQACNASGCSGWSSETSARTQNIFTTIINPTTGQTIASDLLIRATSAGTLGANADSHLLKVDFYVDGVLKGTDSSVPATGEYWEYSWPIAGQQDGAHTVYVIATNTANPTNTYQSSTLNFSLIHPQEIPAIPVNLTAASGTQPGETTVNWSSVSGATSYEITWSTTNPVGTGTLNSTTNSVTHATSAGTTNAIEHSYSVKACNSIGCSGSSATAKAYPKLGVSITGPSTALRNQAVSLNAVPQYFIGSTSFSWQITTNPTGCSLTSTTIQNPSVSCTTAGTAVLRVTVTDSNNRTAFSDKSIVITAETDSVNPTVTITQPQESQIVSGTVNISADATDNETGIKEVRFYVDDVLKANDTTSSYEYSWSSSSVSNGSHTIKAIAEDLAGNTDDDYIMIQVNNKSSVPVCGNGIRETGEECELDAECYSSNARGNCDYTNQKYGTRSVTCNSSCSCNTGTWTYSEKNSSTYCTKCNSCLDEEEGNCNESCDSSDVTAPAKPIGLNVMRTTENSITVEWTPNTEPDLKKYTVYFGRNPRNYDFDETALKNETSLTITGLSGSIKYFIALTATDNSGNTSSYSSEVEATTKGPVSVQAPTGLTASMDGNNVSLQWNHTSPKPDYYIIQRKINDASFEQIATATENSFEDSGVEKGNKYSYRIRASIDGKTSNYSNTAEIELNSCSEEKDDVCDESCENDPDCKKEENLVPWGIGAAIIVVSAALAYVFFTFDI
ncbi:MAG: Ig-like domain-containing protein [archaeon]